jgi:hypothetical protein
MTAIKGESRECERSGTKEARGEKERGRDGEGERSEGERSEGEGERERR